MGSIQINAVKLTIDDRASTGMIWPGLWLEKRLPLLVALVLYVGIGTAVWLGYLSVGVLIGFALCMVCYHAAFLVATRLIQRHLQRQMAQTPIGSAPLSWSFDDEQITQDSSAIKSAVPWTSIIEVLEQSGRLVFVLTPSQWLVLPKRSFASDQEIAALRDLIQKKRDDGSIRGLKTFARAQGTRVT